MNLARLATQPGYHVGPTSVMQPDDIQVPLDHAKPSGPWDAWLKRTCAFWKQTATNNRSEIQSKFFCSKCRSLTVLMSTRGLLPTTLAFPTQIGTLLHLSQTFPTKKSLRFIAMTPPAPPTLLTSCSQPKTSTLLHAAPRLLLLVRCGVTNPRLQTGLAGTGALQAALKRPAAAPTRTPTSDAGAVLNRVRECSASWRASRVACPPPAGGHQARSK